MDNINQRKKYLEELLIEVGFLKKEDNQWENEKDKMCKRKHKVLEYSDKIKNEFLDFMLDLKENSQEKLIVSKFRKEEKKNKNHKFYDDLFKEAFDVDKNNFYLILLNKIEEISHYKDIKSKFCKIRSDERNAYILKDLRKYIRDNKIIFNTIKNDFHKITYSEKIGILKIDLETILEENNCKFWLEYLFKDQDRQLIYFDVFQQLIVYDIINDRIPKEKMENNYNEICKFLDMFINFLESNPEKPLKMKKELSTIFIDFFCFLILREGLLKDTEVLKIRDNIKEDVYKEIKPLDKRIQFLNHVLETAKNEKDIINKEKEKYTDSEKESIECFDIQIDCNNFIELEELQNKINKDTLTVSLNACKELIKDFNLTQGNKAEIIYGKSKVNNFNKKMESLENILETFPFFSKENLQVKKALISNIQNDNKTISPLRKTLKSLIEDEELRQSETVIKNIRLRITKGLFEEKRNEEGFKKSIILEKKINKILMNIFSIKNRELREKYLNKFIDNFFKEIVKIYEDREVLTTKEIKDLVEKQKFYITWGGAIPEIDMMYCPLRDN